MVRFYDRVCTLDYDSIVVVVLIIILIYQHL